jgi:hypothetical protein
MPDTVANSKLCGCQELWSSQVSFLRPHVATIPFSLIETGSRQGVCQVYHAQPAMS